MSASSKKARLAFLGGALIALWFFWQMMRPRPIEVRIDKNELVKAPPAPMQIEVPQIVMTKEVSAEGAPSVLAKKKHWKLPLGHYPQKKMLFRKSHLWIVRGLTASVKKRPGVKEVARLNQFYIYQNSESELDNMVYDDEKRLYGVLTFELTVVVKEGLLSGLAQKYGPSILREGPQGGESILRSDSSLFFTRDLPHFANEQGLMAVRPHVSYGVAKFR